MSTATAVTIISVVAILCLTGYAIIRLILQRVNGINNGPGLVVLGRTGENTTNWEPFVVAPATHTHAPHDHPHNHGEEIAQAMATHVDTHHGPHAAEGLEQARVTGEDLKGQNVTAIVCSPFIRAQQTAEIIAGELEIPLHQITIIEELHERRMGELEGKPKQHETEFFYKNDTNLGFESQKDLIARLKIALDKVKQISQQTAGTTVVVGHATSGFYFLQVAKGREQFEDFDPVSQMGNAEFIEVETGT